MRCEVFVGEAAKGTPELFHSAITNCSSRVVESYFKRCRELHPKPEEVM